MPRKLLALILALLLHACASPAPQHWSGPLVVEVVTWDACEDDAGPDIADAIGDVAAAGGGIVRLPAGCYLIETPIDELVGISVSGYYGGSIVIEGEAGATALVPSVSTSQTAIKLSVTGAVTQSLTIRDLTIAGPDLPGCSAYPSSCTASTYAGLRALELRGTFSRVNVERVSVVGVRTVDSPVVLAGGIFSVRDLVLGGNISYEVGVGSKCLVLLDGVTSATVEGFRGFDYGTTTINGSTKYVPGTTAQCWIRHSPGQPGLLGYDDALDTVTLRDLQLDEGPTYGIISQSLTGPGTYRGQRLTIEGLRISVNGTTAAVGLFLYNQEWVTIRDSLFGYTDLDRYAIKAYNVGSLKVHDVATDEGAGPVNLYADAATDYVEIVDSEFACADIESSATDTLVLVHGQAACTE